MPSAFIDKWNTSLLFVLNNIQEYERYVEDLLVEFFENDITALEHILSISAGLNDGFKVDVFVTLNSDYSDTELSLLYDEVSTKLNTFLCSRSALGAHVYVYNRTQGLGTFTYGKFVVLERKDSNG